MPKPRAFLVVDLAFGDCGKGTIVDFLARRFDAQSVVRFNGGPQAGHNVVLPDGRHHTFSQFGSATFVPGVRTVLSRSMFIEPYAMLNEAAHLRELRIPDALGRLTIDARCPVITPAHQAANRLRELARGADAHGTCGVGFGDAVSDQIERPDIMLQARDLTNRDLVARKLRAICQLKLEEFAGAIATDERAARAIETLSDTSWIDAALENYATVAQCARISETIDIPGTTIYEGAQGVLLDEQFGFHPHTTWSRTTFANAESLLRETGFNGAITRIGLLRSYCTRHGAGPMVSEDDSLRGVLPEPHNGDSGWQGHFRVGLFDAAAARYALRVCGAIDGLAITHLDRLPLLPPRVCAAYLCDDKKIEIPDRADAKLLNHCRPGFTELASMEPESFIRTIEKTLEKPVLIASSGPTHLDKQLRFH